MPTSAGDWVLAASVSEALAVSVHSKHPQEQDLVDQEPDWDSTWDSLNRALLTISSNTGTTTPDLTKPTRPTIQATAHSTLADPITSIPDSIETSAPEHGN